MINSLDAGIKNTKWQKCLYVEQDYPDNYVDSSFLDQLRENENLEHYNYLTVLYGATCVIHQICYTCIFVCIFWLMEEGLLTPKYLVMFVIISTIFFYFVMIIHNKQKSKYSPGIYAKPTVDQTESDHLRDRGDELPAGRGKRRFSSEPDVNLSSPDNVYGDRNSISDSDGRAGEHLVPNRQLYRFPIGDSHREDGRLAILLCTFTFAVSPILGTLTQTVSTDTIYFMTFVALFLNLLFHDYGPTSESMKSSVSLTSAVFAAVCLASRLGTMLHSFSMVLLALQVFAIVPYISKLIYQHPVCNVISTIVLSGFTLLVVSQISCVAAVILSLLFVFILLVCPAWLIRLQMLKNNINGPWDEAVVDAVLTYS